MMLGYIPPLVSPLHALIVGSTLLEYNVHHLFNRSNMNVSWSRAIALPHWLACGTGLVLCFVSLPKLAWDVLAACGILGVLSLAYSTPLLPFRYKQRLKDYGLLKIHVLASVWVLVSVVLPALYWHIPFSVYWLECILRFLLIFPLCIAFDIRDAEADLARGIHTLPNTLGIPAAYRAIHATLSAFLVFGVMNSVLQHSFTLVIVYAISAGAAYFSIRYSRHNGHPYVYLVLIDGVMLLYGLLECLI